jgi:hypothetical protein
MADPRIKKTQTKKITSIYSNLKTAKVSLDQAIKKLHGLKRGKGKV